jgi:predicted DNA-binding transcriptional regulator AlpA
MGARAFANDQAYPPRLMREDRAAAYLDMSRMTFRRRVAEGLLPAPIRLHGVVLWDRLELDAACEDFKAAQQRTENRNTAHALLDREQQESTDEDDREADANKDD